MINVVDQYSKQFFKNLCKHLIFMIYFYRFRNIQLFQSIQFSCYQLVFIRQFFLNISISVSLIMSAYIRIDCILWSERLVTMAWKMYFHFTKNSNITISLTLQVQVCNWILTTWKVQIFPWVTPEAHGGNPHSLRCPEKLPCHSNAKNDCIANESLSCQFNKATIKYQFTT